MKGISTNQYRAYVKKRTAEKDGGKMAVPSTQEPMFEVKMKRNQHYREQIQTRQIPVSFQCNLCLRIFSANHGKNIHLNSCRKRSSPAESTARVRSFQHDQA